LTARIDIAKLGDGNQREAPVCRHDPGNHHPGDRIEKPP
jgi:hypothetical protein